MLTGSSMRRNASAQRFRISLSPIWLVDLDKLSMDCGKGVKGYSVYSLRSDGADPFRE
ncbi:hypothetical protein OKW18_006738 [Streptomyces pratensis]|jgi:hypothetical protein|nr:hypothetical protein [Streptomyces pratensis]